MMITAALLLMISAAASTETAPLPPPRLCLGTPGSDLMAGRCIDAAKKEIDVDPDAKSRGWIWIDSSRKAIAFGTLAPNQSKIIIDDKPAGLLSISGSADRGWPAATTMTIRSGKDSWKFTLPRDAVASLREIAAPAGSYDLHIEAPRHIPLDRRAQKMSHEKPAQLGRFELKPVPMLRGRFIDREGNPVGDVSITTPAGAALATSDPAGLVREELKDALPPRLFVRRNGFGHRNIDVTRADADYDLGTVTLSPGSTLTVNIDRNGYDGPLTASLIRPGEHTIGQRTTFETATAKPGASLIEFRDIEARDYVLILRGEGPLQTMRNDINVSEHENAAKDVRLNGPTVTAFVHQGSTPAKETPVNLVGPNGEWTSNISTDTEGRFRTQAWVEGYIGIQIERSSNVWYTTSATVGRIDTEWNIDIPDRTIHGIIVDKETNAPVPEKYVSLRTVRLLNSSGGGLRSVPVSDDATFTVEMVEPGRYEITVHDPAYLDNTVGFDVKPDDHQREVRVEMKHGRNVQVQIVNAEGTPVTNAIVMARRVLQDAPRGWTSDATGMVTIAFSGNDPLPVWVVSPADGFAFASVAPDAKPEARQIVLPPATATIAIRTHHEDGSPSAHTHVFLSYNGALMPNDVREAFPHERLITGSDGATILTHMPVGEYGFWTWETPEEHVAFNPRNVGAVTPASVLPGENNVTLIVKPPAKAGK
jgi:hypothetical protein